MTSKVVYRFNHYDEVFYQGSDLLAPASSDLTCGNGGEWGGQGRVCQQDVGWAEWTNKDVSWGCQQGVSHLGQILIKSHSCLISHLAFTLHTAPL